MPDVPLTLADRYSIESQIAAGGMASVWRARDEVLARIVAVKILHEHLGEDPSFLERFHREALAAARLTHPGIVAIYDTGSQIATGSLALPFIVMEHCGGGTLAHVAAEEEVLEPHRVVSIGKDICDALAYAHRKQVIHRDVKPANVLIADDGSLKVADFGIAKAAFEGDITTTGIILGTVAYISPEQAKGLEPDARSDLYSLGIVLYELLVGRPPFSEESQVATAMMHINEKPMPPRSLRAGIPRSLEAVLLRALAKDPDDRFSSAEEMAAALDTTGTNDGRTVVLPARARVSAPSQDEQRTGEARWIAFTLGLVALAVLLAWGVARLVQQDDAPGGDAGPGNGGGAPATRPVDVQQVSDFDPHGGDGEHPEEAFLAADGNPATSWTTETYNDSFQLLQKPGVGLMFDLGEAVEVDRIDIASDPPGSIWEIRTADQPGADEIAFRTVADVAAATASNTIDVDGARARYWLLWITSLPEGAGSVAVSEVRFFAN